MKALKFDGLVVSDRDIVDLLESQKHKISREKILTFLQERGIFCAENESRTSLHELIASLNIDWFLIEDLLSLAASSEDNQKVTATNFSITQKDAIEKTLDNLKQELAHKDFIVDKLNNGSFEIQYKTEKLERNNARLIQRTSKDEKIAINVDGDKISMISSVGEGTEPVIAKFFDELSRNCKTEVESTNINFSYITSSEIINKFFLDLIKIDESKYKVTDVIKLKLNKFDSSDKGKELELEDVDIYEDTNEENLPFKVSKESEPNKEDIKSALISGSSLLTSQVFKSFAAKGYFISSITWIVTEKTGDKRKIEYSASFVDPDKRDIFTYESKGFYEVNPANDEYKKNKTKWKRNQKKIIEFNFQKVAFDLFKKITIALDSGEKDG
ncbi:hypothetical protein ACT4X9_08245 [Acinetobacter baumannii]|nr:hypothetical protein [Acinetobacter baumannii]